ncbi:putative peptidoglycan-binding domain-containing protein [Candidatus Magnetominusculus xianensis]|uniref:Peptidoglycan binding domain-containing protein n=1 Tax=Candidatus Magnetominusculus xianensis TaxID=1748249 RepID=A0ABR5SBM7_9BACT|nr:putative peptidoglycan-binding domain-containing protein [Candidatus Magnetominusculus xianensis]KWT77356.1 hypothetical protein ASN18_3051 [Candidatus Magnetominusculus xianensis]
MLALLLQREPPQMAAEYIDRRRQYYSRIAQTGKRRKYLTGWLNRLERLAEYIAEYINEDKEAV